MIKCPFCHFDNEDGALFCERCTSDLAVVAPAPVEVVPPIPIAEPVAIPLAGDTGSLGGLPLATAEPVEAIGLESVEPLAAVPLAPVEPLPSNPPLQDIPLAPIAPVYTPEPPVAATAAPPPPPPPPAAPAAATSTGLTPTSEPRLLVLRGIKRNVEYPIYEGQNFVGRADEKPVDIDLEEQEPPERIWCSRQHACISWENGELSIEDLNSANGTYVNRTKVYPGQRRQLQLNDVIQIGNVQLKVIA